MGAEELRRLHGLRALAAAAVALFHWAYLFPGVAQALKGAGYVVWPWLTLALPLELGWQGVPLFFVLSAYLLSRQWWSRGITVGAVGRYLGRRAMRIYPAFWLQLLVLALLMQVGLWPVPDWGWREWLATLALWVHMPGLWVTPLNGVWWTLPVELLFYLCLPLLIGVARRMGIWVMWLGCVVATLAWRWAAVARYPGQDMSAHLPVLDALPGVLSTFAAGVVLAHALEGMDREGRSLKLWWLGVAVGAGVVLQAALQLTLPDYWRGHLWLLVWGTCFASAVALGVGAWLRWSGAPRWAFGRMAVWLGERSFGIYLWHFPVLQVLDRLWADGQTTVAAALWALLIMWTFTLAMADISYRWLERPLMGWR